MDSAQPTNDVVAIFVNSDDDRNHDNERDSRKGKISKKA